MNKCYKDCKHLTLTEAQQDLIYEETLIRPQHFCRKYEMVLKHGTLHPDLTRLDKCKYIKFSDRVKRFLEFKGRTHEDFNT